MTPSNATKWFLHTQIKCLVLGIWGMLKPSSLSSVNCYSLQKYHAWKTKEQSCVCSKNRWDKAIESHLPSFAIICHHLAIEYYWLFNGDDSSTNQPKGIGLKIPCCVYLRWDPRKTNMCHIEAGCSLELTQKHAITLTLGLCWNSV